MIESQAGPNVVAEVEAKPEEPEASGPVEKNEDKDKDQPEQGMNKQCCT
jgi:hypothetical protein